MAQDVRINITADTRAAEQQIKKLGSVRIPKILLELDTSRAEAALKALRSTRPIQLDILPQTGRLFLRPSQAGGKVPRQ